jgi:hypothetical protein
MGRPRARVARVATRGFWKATQILPDVELQEIQVINPVLVNDAAGNRGISCTAVTSGVVPTVQWQSQKCGSHSRGPLRCSRRRKASRYDW